MALEAKRDENGEHEDHCEAEKRGVPKQTSPWPPLLRTRGIAAYPRRHKGGVPRIRADSASDRLGSLTASG